MADWQLSVLAGGRLQKGEKILSLERKTAALLSYLCLEGPTSRSKLAGLLWPDSSEHTARANLRQLLKRLREASGDELISADDPMSISSELECDAAKLQVAAFLERHDQLGSLSGEFLSGYDYDDCPDFDDWRLATRDRLAEVRRELLMNALQKHEESGDYRSALDWAQQLLASNPISEETHRSVMRLHYQLGDRPAALKAYQRCKDILKREFGVEPLAETVALARAIDQGSVTPQSGNRTRQPSIPLSILRPPVLAGREAAWAQLEQAWAQSKPIFVSGDPGIGKSRLISDFVASKGAFLLLEARPNDRHIPLSSHARYLRQMLQMTSDPLEPWVRSELSRLIPELSDTGPISLNSATDKLRLIEAEFTLAQRATRGLVAIVNDDLHYMDATSFEAAVNLAARLVAPWQEDGPRSLSAFRRGELAPVVEAELHRLLAADAAVLIELEPLSPAAVRDMLGGLELSELNGLSDFFSRYTGGNPLFIVETVKSLFEAGALGRALPKHLPLPGRVRALLSQRLARLSASALRLLQVAALADEAFDTELARDVLDMDLLQLTDALAELEAAQMLRGGRFSHNLLLETVREELPLSVKALLWERISEALGTGEASAELARLHTARHE